MTKHSSILATILLVVMIASITFLAALGKDIESIIQFFATAGIPSAIAFYGARKAEKAEHNTNGRLSQVISLLQDKGVDIPEGYEDVRPDAYVNGYDETAPGDVDDDHPLYK
jgi:hypothetical protein